ncbi:hypothetical protein D3C72_958760 [compost metagenome]
MNVIYAGTDVVRIAEILECLQQLHIGARRFDRDHVRIHGGDGFDDVVELRIAHVRMDLRLVAHAGRRQAEAIHRPVQVGLPIGTAQRQAFADGRLVDLDDADAGRFQVHHFVAQGQRQLAARLLARLIIPHERPLQDGDRTRQHALDRLVGQRLRVRRPAHRHRRGAGHVAENDRRLDAARAIALYPAVLGEGKTGQ